MRKVDGKLTGNDTGFGHCQLRTSDEYVAPPTRKVSKLAEKRNNLDERARGKEQEKVAL